MYRPTFLAVFVCTLFSCQQDFTQQHTPSDLDQIAPELKPHFLRFQSEAERYGLTFDYREANITAEIYNIDEGSVAGSCSTDGHTQRHIRIDRSFWNRSSDMVREMVIYHELGHCLLGRGHREDTFGNGICKSIMRSGLGSCRDAYTTDNRSYFLEELFAVTP